MIRRGALLLFAFLFGLDAAAETNIETIAAGVAWPGAIAVDRGGNLFVTSGGNDVVFRRDARSHEITYPIHSSAVGLITVDGAGNLYYVEGGGYSPIKKWTASTHVTETLIESTNLMIPAQIAVDDDGNLFVSDQTNGVVVKRDHATDLSGNIYLLAENATIKKWTASTGAISTIVTAGLNQTSSLTVDANGNIYVTDVGDGTIKKWSPVTQSMTTIASGLDYPAGVAVDSDGTVFFTDPGVSALKAVAPIERRRSAPH